MSIELADLGVGSMMLSMLRNSILLFVVAMLGAGCASVERNLADDEKFRVVTESDSDAKFVGLHHIGEIARESGS